jgi:hypothetical protein
MYPFFFVLIVGIYFLPSNVAERRHHRFQRGILILNILLGWTIVGWAAALVWALTDQIDPHERIEGVAGLFR